MKNNNIQNFRRDIKKEKKIKYVDKKFNKDVNKNKHKEKIEKLVKNINPSRTSLMNRDLMETRPARPSTAAWAWDSWLAALREQVRIGGKGTSRRKKKSVKGKLFKKDINNSKKQIMNAYPIKYEKADCCVCYELVKMSKKNTIDCNGKPRALCYDCKGNMTKDVCPLCNNHSIGLKNSVWLCSSQRFSPPTTVNPRPLAPGSQEYLQLILESLIIYGQNGDWYTSWD
jgi:hypothetical protein